MAHIPLARGVETPYNFHMSGLEESVTDLERLTNGAEGFSKPPGHFFELRLSTGLKNSSSHRRWIAMSKPKLIPTDFSCPRPKLYS
jgi:hypothetical protein